MSRLFQPSGLPISEKRNSNPNPVQVLRKPSRILGSAIPPVSKIFQVRPWTADEKLGDAHAKTSIPSRPSSSRTWMKVDTPQTTKAFKITQNVDEVSVPDEARAPVTSSSGARKSAVVPIPPPSLLRKELSLQIRGMTSTAPMGTKVEAIGAKRTRVPQLGIAMTPSGPQQVLNKIKTEKRLERTKHGEVVARNIRTVKMDISTEEAIQIEEELQKFNPDFPTPKGLVKEIVSVVSETDITASYEISRKNVVRETTTSPQSIHFDKVEKLVNEEREDISNILRNTAPELVNQTPELISLKKRLQHLRCSPGNNRLLAESIVDSGLNAASTLPEASPELIATIMDTSEKATHSTIPTEQLFNYLFTQEQEENPFVILSSATPGPMEDVVIPTFLQEDVHEQMLTSKMEQVSALVQLTNERPPLDSFSQIQPGQPKKRGRRRRPYEPLLAEDPPWCNEALIVSIEAVGAHPKYSLNATNVIESKSYGTLLNDASRGIEYILNSQSHQYISKVQLRGSRPPSWFPGYMVALTNMPGPVSLAKSPSEVLLSAWKSVQPEVFSDESVVYN